MRRLHHVGYWLYDLDAALEQWGQDLGVGPFDVIGHMTFDSFSVPWSSTDSSTATWSSTNSAAFAAWGPVVVELSQVHAIDDRLAAAYGSAAAGPAGVVSHVSWVVPDVAEESDRLARLGCLLINTARSGPISVAWHDGGPLFPHPIEVHQHNSVIAGMHDRLVALRAGEDQ